MKTPSQKTWNALALTTFFAFCLSISSANAAHDNGKIQMAITVDDLPDHAELPRGWSFNRIKDGFISAFEKHNIKGVYGFVNSAVIKNDQPELIHILEDWRAAGHKLGNHTFSHPDYATTTFEDYTKNILDNEEILGKLAPPSEYKFFRFPFLSEGNTLEKFNSLRDFLHAHQYTVAPITTDFQDWRWNDVFPKCTLHGTRSELQWLKDQYLARAKEDISRAESDMTFRFNRPVKHVLLMHFGAFDAMMIDQLLSQYEQMGIEFISLEDALTDPIYRDDGPPALPGTLRSLSERELQKDPTLTDTPLDQKTDQEEKDEDLKFQKMCKGGLRSIFRR